MLSGSVIARGLFHVRSCSFFQIREQMLALHREKVHPYRIEVAEDAHRAEELRLEFEASVYTHAMVCDRLNTWFSFTCTNSVVHTQSGFSKCLNMRIAFLLF